MHHKRKGPKSSRAGCLLCKPHKANGAKNRSCNHTLQERKGRLAEKEQRVEASMTARWTKVRVFWSSDSGRELHSRKQLESRE